MAYAAVFLYVLIMAASASATINRIGVWKNDISLWTDSVRKSPDNLIARFSLANAYLETGDDKRAVAEYLSVIEINPRVAQAYYNLGVVYTRQSLIKEACAEFRKALAVNPEYNEAKLRLMELEALSAQSQEVRQNGSL